MTAFVCIDFPDEYSNTKVSFSNTKLLAVSKKARYCYFAKSNKTENFVLYTFSLY